MGSIWFAPGAYVATLSEMAGYKSGLALGRKRIGKLLRSDKETTHVWPGTNEGVRVRSEEFEATCRWLLFKLGVVKAPSSTTFEWIYYASQDPARAPIAADIVAWLGDCARSASFGPIDVTPVFSKAAEKYGRAGLGIVEQWFETIQDHLRGSAVSQFRLHEWQDEADLESLFRGKADAPPTHGEFFDQRFVHYLAANFDEVDQIFWRQLERLTAEFFARQDFRVQLGPGRGDGGVDVRVWRDRDATAPTIIVQCKRQKAKVPQVVVKALYADVLHEKADSGLVVTTSRLEPGAAKVCVARDYRVGAVERDALRRWVLHMRLPGAGGPVEPG